MEFWHNMATEKSFRLLQILRKKYRFILIGGWAIFLYTQALKSKDIDLIVDYEVLGELKRDFPVTKNERLKKYEIKKEEVDVDIYVPFYSNPGLPPEEIKNHLTSREGFVVPLPEILLILKQKAFKERADSPKGEKDKIDIFSLLKTVTLDWKLYQEILKKYNQGDFQKNLVHLLTSTFEIKELALKQPKIAKIRKEVLESLG